MGIYLKGMEMPKEIDQSITIEFATGLSGKLYARYHDHNSGGSTEWHDVMTIPEPHGRLIDADAVERNLVKMQMTQKDVVGHGIRKSRAVVRDMPTIIEAEE